MSESGSPNREGGLCAAQRVCRPHGLEPITLPLTGVRSNLFRITAAPFPNCPYQYRTSKYLRTTSAAGSCIKEGSIGRIA